MFILIVIILISIFAVEIKNVFFIIIMLFSSIITLLIPYGNGGYGGLLVVLNIKSNVCNLDDYNADIYGLSI